jgi:hypothetical protein
VRRATSQNEPRDDEEGEGSSFRHFNNNITQNSALARKALVVAGGHGFEEVPLVLLHWAQIFWVLENSDHARPARSIPTAKKNTRVMMLTYVDDQGVFFNFYGLLIGFDCQNWHLITPRNGPKNHKKFLRLQSHGTFGINPNSIQPISVKPKDKREKIEWPRI